MTSIKNLEEDPTAISPSYSFTNGDEKKAALECFLKKAGEWKSHDIPVTLTAMAPLYLQNFTLLILQNKDIKTYLQENYRPVDLLRLSLNLYLREKRFPDVIRFLYVLNYLPQDEDKPFREYSLFIYDTNPILTRQFLNDIEQKLQDFKHIDDEVLNKPELKEFFSDEKAMLPQIGRLSVLGAIGVRRKTVPLRWKCPIHNCETHDIYISYASENKEIAQLLQTTLSDWTVTPNEEGKSPFKVRPFLLDTCCANLPLEYKKEIIERELQYTPMCILLITEQGLTSIKETNHHLYLEYEAIINSSQLQQISVIRLYPKGHEHKQDVWIDGLRELWKKCINFPEYFYQDNFDCIKSEVELLLQSWTTRRETFSWLPADHCIIEGLRLSIGKGRVYGSALWSEGVHYFEVFVEKPSKTAYIGVVLENQENYLDHDKKLEYAYSIDSGNIIKEGKSLPYDTIPSNWKGGMIGVLLDFSIGTIEFCRDGKLLGLNAGIKGPLRPAVYSSTRATFTLQQTKVLPPTPRDLPDVIALKAKIEEKYRTGLSEDDQLPLFNKIITTLANCLEQKNKDEDTIDIHTSLLEETERKITSQKYENVVADLAVLREELSRAKEDINAKSRALHESKLRPAAKKALEKTVAAAVAATSLTERQITQLELQKTVLVYLDRLVQSLLLALSLKSFGKRISGLLRKVPALFQSLLDVTFKLGVVGVLKAGKSTIGDALVGKNFLPSGGLACTALPIRLRHVPKLETPTLELPIFAQLNLLALRTRNLLLSSTSIKPPNEEELKELMEKLIQKEGNIKFVAKYTGIENIQQALMEANYLERLGLILNFELKANNKLPVLCPQINKLEDTPMVDTTFRSLGDRRLLGELILVDTPGSNEESFSSIFDPMVRNLIEECDTSLCIVSAANCQNNDHFRLIDTVNQCSLKQSQKYYVLLNRKDEINEKSIPAAIEAIKARTTNEPFIIPCSAKLALVAWQAARYLEEHHRLPDVTDSSPSWVTDFASMVYGMVDNDTKLASATEETIKSSIRALLDASGLDNVILSFTDNTAEKISENRSKKLLTNILRIVADQRRITNSSITREGAGRKGLLALGGCLVDIKLTVKMALTNLKTKGAQLLKNLESTIELELEKVSEDVIRSLPQCEDKTSKSQAKAETWLKNFLGPAEDNASKLLAAKFDLAAIVVKEEATKIQKLFIEAKKQFVGQLETVQNEQGNNINRKVYFQDLLNIGLDEITEDYNYQINRDSKGFLAFVTDQAKLISGKRAYWWTFWYFKVSFREANISGEQVRARLEALVRDSVGAYRTLLMNGVHAIWKTQALLFEEKLERNMEDIERDLTMAANKRGGKDDRIAGLQILGENLSWIERETNKFKQSLSIYEIEEEEEPGLESKSGAETSPLTIFTQRVTALVDGAHPDLNRQTTLPSSRSRSSSAALTTSESMQIFP